MESFKWGKEFITGLAKVDAQHQELVSMINNLGKVIAENTSAGDLSSILNKLSAYAKEHFYTEAKFMEQMQVDIRHIKSHVRKHADFVADVTSIAESIDVDNSEGIRIILEFLIHWLSDHILGTDQNMARQIAQIQAGDPPDAAYNNGERDANSSTEPLVAALSGLFAIVSKRNKALSELNRTLEMRVAERTAELEKTNEALEKISITDHLTELPNRRFAIGQLQLLLEESIGGNQPLACMMVDADGFKMINDTHGHDAGDVVLKRLAQELSNSVRSDDIVCRLGGDEFIVICPNTDLKGALFLGEQTRGKIASLRVPAGDGYWIGSVSIGVACTTQEKIKDVNSFLKAADEAVYEAKNCGRNCVKAN